jgi:hypothetical protein
MTAFCHSVFPEDVRAFADSPVASRVEFLRHTKAGPVSWKTGDTIVRYILQEVRDDYLTLETGAGCTTIAFATTAGHHICISPDAHGVTLIREYIEQAGIPRDRVTLARPIGCPTGVR